MKGCKTEINQDSTSRLQNIQTLNNTSRRKKSGGVGEPADAECDVAANPQDYLIKQHKCQSVIVHAAHPIYRVRGALQSIPANIEQVTGHSLHWSLVNRRVDTETNNH